MKAEAGTCGQWHCWVLCKIKILDSSTLQTLHHRRPGRRTKFICSRPHEVLCSAALTHPAAH